MNTSIYAVVVTCSGGGGSMMILRSSSIVKAAKDTQIVERVAYTHKNRSLIGGWRRGGGIMAGLE